MKRNLSSLLTIIVPTYNRAESLERCLRSLEKQKDGNFDILIIDGGSKDVTQNVIKKYINSLDIKLVVNKTFHLAYIRDLGWRKAKGEIIASIDDDVVVSSGWVKAIKETLQDKSVGGITGPTVIDNKLLQNRDVFLFHTTKNPFLKIAGKIYFSLFMQGEKNAIGKIYPSGAWSPGSNFPSSLKLKKPIEVDYLEACNFAIPKKILKKIGGYNLNYKGTSEWCEVDVAFKIRKLGYRLIFDPHVSVFHNVSKKGVFKNRLNFSQRFANILLFYKKTYYPKTFKGITLFILYLIFNLCYFFLKKLKAF